MTSFVTQCPHCQTSFRVSRTQLGAAQGVVRCGACMELFNAARHLQDADTAGSREATTDATALAPVSGASSGRAAQGKPAGQDDTFWIHDDLDLDSLDLDEELAKLERQELELSREFLELEPQPGEQQLHPHADHSTDDDEAWAEQLLSEDSEPQERNEPPEAQPEPIAEHPRDTAEIRFTPVSAEHPAPPSPLGAPGDPVIGQLNATERAEPVVNLTTDADGDDGQTTLAARDRIGTERESPRPPRQDREERLFDLDDEPLQLAWQARRRPWGRWLGWGLLNLIALLGLATQYVIYNFDELARQDEYRPWLEKICPALDCKLPPRVDISQIKSSNLVVRSHPDFAGALVVDAIIYNRASFAQPFPLLEVRFDDIRGNTLARRTFKPGEYLSGELAGQREMPSQVPIHIALDILDPGTEAVNYSLAFRSPD
ncbi:DUF3426 domain-containing protein [Stutzerimonas stutzeri]|jgi:predicted Zn finger-like uncharacterized protein|uniref:Putative Zn finger-like uncharacterized protein n=1 Tax=Stutzerimonas stutzeri TaxID=316 RepID=A0A5S5B9S6_STUST|nr:DUF3426 domain-containing protein [Stutzerimonas stutzeri]TYP63258.1 putative Zn finger-like uncharacterized protein [Stutzerimonas stutzeri]